MTKTRIRTVLEMIKIRALRLRAAVRARGSAAGRARGRRPADLAANLVDRRRHGWRAFRGDDHEPHRRHRISTGAIRAPPIARSRPERFRSASPGRSRSLASAVLVVAAWQLNPLALELSPAALAVLFLYSYTKRFTAWSHFVLGFCLGISPAAAWIAIRGSLDWRMLILCAAVTLWVGGFDVLYACQDVDFDRAAGLHSIPKKFGIAGALRIARVMHVADGRAARLARLGVSIWPGPRGWASPWSRCCSATNIRSSSPTTSAK